MIQKTGSIHVYFQRNKGHLAGVILCSILAGMGETDAMISCLARTNCLFCASFFHSCSFLL